MTTSNIIGTLVVVVLKAQNLPDKHLLFKQDVYAKVDVLCSDGSSKQTGVDVKGGQHPVWDEELRFPITSDLKTKKVLEVECWSKEVKGDDCLGKGTVDLTQTVKTGEFDDWVKLEKNGAYRGEIYLEMTFYAQGPAPLNRRASKMTPNQRTSRPRQQYVYQNLQRSTNPHLTPPSSNPGSSQSSRESSPARLAVPSQLAPGAGIRTSSQGAHLRPPEQGSPPVSPQRRHDVLPPVPEDPRPLLGPVPSILRPGNPRGNIHPQQDPLPVPSIESGPRHAPTAPTGYPSPPMYPHAQTSAGPAYHSVTASYTRPPGYSPPLPPRRNQESGLPDPLLVARYQTPLPLPSSSLPGASAYPPYSFTSSPPASTQPLSESPPRRDPREEARRIASEEEERRRAQEEADAALAKELDRQFNMPSGE